MAQNSVSFIKRVNSNCDLVEILSLTSLRHTYSWNLSMTSKPRREIVRRAYRLYLRVHETWDKDEEEANKDFIHSLGSLRDSVYKI